ncbi:MAG: hypothetical protein RLZ98_2114, partial [Pseudomonadota bacterium]
MPREPWRLNAVSRRLASLLAAVAVFAFAATGAGAEPNPFKIANYPVDAVAEDAARAQQQALADGRRAALRSLLKRLLPVTAYRELPKLKATDPTRLISRVAVRSAQNSSTQYIASLDFTFDEGGVKALLRQRGIPFIEEPAPETILVTVVAASDPAIKDGLRLVGGRAATAWSGVWRDLDLENAIAPLKPQVAKAGVDPVAIQAARSGDSSLLTRLATAYNASRVILAVAEVDQQQSRLKVTLAGQDAV